jgi:hypothetical protein
MSFSLLVAVPTHSQTIVVETAQTLVAAQEMVLRRGGSFRLHFESGATISLVRNAIVAEFLQSDADLLLMLDSDQGFHPDTLERMIDFGKPMVGCVCPRRMYDWSRVDPDSKMHPQQLVYQATDFIGRLIADKHGNTQLVNGFAPATHVGTGILALRREVFDRLMIHFPELERRGFGADAYPRYKEGGRWGFFNPMENDAGVPLSEDLSFSKRWLKAGGEIWADVSSSTIHVGRYPFGGSLLEKIEVLSGGEAGRPGGE